jgi:peptide-methionine (R)-S-oxide reductase
MTTLPVSRRRLIGWLGAATALPLIGACSARAATFPVHHTDAEWKALLTPAQYAILRQQGTERPFSSALLNEHRRGRFVCAADGNPLYSSATKFDSGTGWPSFWKPLPGAIGTSRDLSLGELRTEVHCARCGGHLGHVFDDGPAPTGLRYCMDGDAMKFRAG